MTGAQASGSGFRRAGGSDSSSVGDWGMLEVDGRRCVICSLAVGSVAAVRVRRGRGEAWQYGVAKGSADGKRG